MASNGTAKASRSLLPLAPKPPPVPSSTQDSSQIASRNRANTHRGSDRAFQPIKILEGSPWPRRHRPPDAVQRPARSLSVLYYDRIAATASNDP
jgi:hypothetical protein